VPFSLSLKLKPQGDQLMAKNDLVLLDALLEKKLAEYSDVKTSGELFDLFVFENLLKDNDLSYEEIEQGWVDGGDDGGIDGLFVLLDGLHLTEVPNSNDVRKHPQIEVVIITCKHEATFRQVPLNNLLASIPELLDLSVSSDSFDSKYNDEVLDQRDLFCATYKELAARQPSLFFRYIYASRGDTALVAENIAGRARLIESKMFELFSNCSSSFLFLGASELLQMARKQRSSTLTLRFIENYVSRAKSDYVVLCTLADYYRFITDEAGDLRRYLFESNVRDFLGHVPVNEDIAVTLAGSSKIDQCDFWWLNNGITIVATAANVAGKEINLENIQIVNGLQTTETIYEHFQMSVKVNDDRAVLVKIIVTNDAEIRDRIIKATNYQTAVELASLRATEKIQRDIEDILLKHNWFYDRRKNYHWNQGRPTQRIISPGYLASCILALVLKEPAKAGRLRTKFMRIDDQYNRIFDTSLDIRIYPAVVAIVKAVESYLVERRSTWGQNYAKFPQEYRGVFAYVWAARNLGGANFSTESLLTQTEPSITSAEIEQIWHDLGRIAKEKNYKPRRLYRNEAVIKEIVDI
jgi:hypothetical protein